VEFPEFSFHHGMSYDAAHTNLVVVLMAALNRSYDGQEIQNGMIALWFHQHLTQSRSARVPHTSG
jgi:hypothetical protein